MLLVKIRVYTDRGWDKLNRLRYLCDIPSFCLVGLMCFSWISLKRMMIISRKDSGIYYQKTLQNAVITIQVFQVKKDFSVVSLFIDCGFVSHEQSACFSSISKNLTEFGVFPKKNRNVFKLYKVDIIVQLEYKYQLKYCMHSKIYKAKLISIHTAQQQTRCQDKQEGSQAIHAYFGMLQHIFQRNKYMVRELKLSGTKILDKKREQSRGSFMGKKQSELVRSKNRTQKQRGRELEQYARQKSITNCGLMLKSVRNRSVQPSYRRQSTAKKDSHIMNQEQIFQFVPLGQASQRNMVLSTRSLQFAEQNQLNSSAVMLTSPHDNSVKQVLSQREQKQQPKKQSLKINRRSCKIKTQTSEAKTNYSSIRTTQTSNKQPTQDLKLPATLHQVTPW